MARQITSRFIYQFTEKSIPGWSKQLKEFHVSELAKLDYRERLFMIWDRQYPYTLEIVLNRINTEMVARPVITNKGIGTTIVTETSPTTLYTRRFQSETDVVNTISEIIKLQKIYDQFLQDQEETFFQKIQFSHGTKFSQ